MEDKAKEILIAVYEKATEDKVKAVINIIESDDNSTGKATVICDYLGIQRRDNRREIISVLES